MLHKFRLLLIPVLATLFLAACDSETNVIEEEAADTMVSEDSTVSDEPQTEESIVEESEETSGEPVAEEPVTEKVENTPTVETTTSEETEALNPSIQAAVDQLLAETDIELENYVFFFTETEEHVEIEVRENIDGESTSLVGIYRYIFETDELLVNDYLTGEFISFENIQ